jgi:hypothetical protein
MSATPKPTRQDTYAVNVKWVTPDGDEIDTGIWDKMTGGELDSDETKYNPGAMAPPVSLGGRKTTGNVVVSRLYRLVRDHDHVKNWLGYVGRYRVKVSKQPMDIEGNVYGNPVVYVGILKRLSLPEVDSESSGAGLIEIEVSVEGYPAVG